VFVVVPVLVFVEVLVPVLVEVFVEVLVLVFVLVFVLVVVPVLVVVVVVVVVTGATVTSPKGDKYEEIYYPWASLQYCQVITPKHFPYSVKYCLAQFPMFKGLTNPEFITSA